MEKFLQSRIVRSLSIFSLALVIALSMIVVAGNYSASQSSGTSVTTCYNKKTGAMRYLVKGKCKKSETTLSIGQVGPQGPAGANGTNGAQGATGPAGAQGSTGPAGLDGTAVNVGATGATGATGARGPSGLTSGISVVDVFYASPVLPSNFPALVIARTNEISNLGFESTDRLTIESDAWVQITATLMIAADANASQEFGIAECSLLRGAHDSPISSFQTISWSRANISEASAAEAFDGQLTVIGSANFLAGEYDLAISCIRSQSSPEVSVIRVDLNAVAIG